MIAPILTGLLLGTGAGVLISHGRWLALIALLPLAVGLRLVARALVPQPDRAVVGAVVALGFALHVAVAVILFTGSLAVGRGGFIPGDDRAYAEIAGHFVRYLQGTAEPPWVPPYWAGEAYLFGTWVYLESAIFMLIGPEVLVPILLNGAFALVTALLVFDITRTIFDRHAAFIALGLVTFYPSLVLWSSLNLKDALALLLVGLCLWGLTRFQRLPRASALALAFMVLIPMESLRHYLFFGLALLIPIVVVVTPHLTLAGRARWTGAAVVTSALMLAMSQAPTVQVGPELLGTFDQVRGAMARGARTAYVEPPPLLVKEGDTFIIAAPSGPTALATAPTATPVTEPPATPVTEPTATPVTEPTSSASPRIVHIEPNTRLAVIPPDSPPRTPSPGVVYVHPGDIVVVGGASTTPQPVAQELVLPSASPRVLSTATPGEGTFTRRTLEHLPIGLAFAILGPFPWMFARAADLAVVPDLILWYVIAAAAVVTVLRKRSRWPYLAGLALLVIGVIGLLALAEGNWGTMFRHRSMVLPWAIVLAAPTLAGAAPMVRRFVEDPRLRPAPDTSSSSEATRRSRDQ